ncbi:hypothetical protein HanRHA438_Chr17g0815721 [Helianthus annuus]|nr:hypothetical protein HanHA89_Chr17g0708791 [Helianthus annuus]KAJ0632639.1 hypothetical protein HanLR1_Chr17g0667401 [Helianthus annuus]KAJ0826561.1 hypothetical protein HanRHA438_Chr17g0815721 [Helianthus annuus]
MYLNVGSMEMEKNVTISSAVIPCKTIPQGLLLLFVVPVLRKVERKKKDNDPPKK